MLSRAVVTWNIDENPINYVKFDREGEMRGLTFLRSEDDIGRVPKAQLSDFTFFVWLKSKVSFVLTNQEFKRVKVVSNNNR